MDNAGVAQTTVAMARDRLPWNLMEGAMIDTMDFQQRMHGVRKFPLPVRC